MLASTLRVSTPLVLCALAGFAKIVEATELNTWKAYFEWQLLRDASPYLNKAFADADFAFYSGVINGVTVQEPRWKSGVRVVEGSIGEGLGKLGGAFADREGKAFEAEHRRGALGKPPIEEAAGAAVRQVSGARNFDAHRYGVGHRLSGQGFVKPGEHEGDRGFRQRQDLEGKLGHDAERAMRADHDLGQVQAGDVLHDPTATLDGLAQA
eukprot:gene2822-3316_t